tara:strand:+ start:862 stop:1011 length:150 start_codon:yes stop_codon:yes gene_type:complete
VHGTSANGYEVDVHSLKKIMCKDKHCEIKKPAFDLQGQVLFRICFILIF